MRNKDWFRIHSFAGVVTGLMLFVICWSGTFAVLSNEIDWLVTPQARVEAREQRAGWDALMNAVRRAYPEAEIQWIQAPPYRASAAEAVINLPQQSFVRVYVDPYTAEVRGAYSYLNVQRFFRSIHYSLFLPDAGLYLVSAFSIPMLLSLASALVFYRRWWRRFFRLLTSGARVSLSELHKSAGLWSIWFVAVIAVTGTWYLVEAARYDFGDGKFVFAGTSGSALHRIPRPKNDSRQPIRSLDALIAGTLALRPDLDVRTVSTAFSHDGVLYLDGQTRRLLVRDRANQIHVDMRSGKILYDQAKVGASAYWRWADTADPLHFGDFAGLTSKVVWFVFGLLASGLVLSGTWLHARRLARVRDGDVRHRWPGTAAATLVTIGLLFASARFGFLEAREFYGPVVDGLPELPALAPGVEAVIVGWVALTVAIIAAWVAVLWKPRLALRNQRRLTTPA